MEGEAELCSQYLNFVLQRNIFDEIFVLGASQTTEMGGHLSSFLAC
jgi:hypothetical protein